MGLRQEEQGFFSSLFATLKYHQIQMHTYVKNLENIWEKLKEEMPC